MSRRCAVKNCKSLQSENHFFSVKKCSNYDDIKRYLCDMTRPLICQKHFEFQCLRVTLKKDANPTIFEDLECEEKKDALLDHNYFIEAEKERKAACKKTEVIEMMDKKLRNARKRKRKVEEENVSLGNKIGMYIRVVIFVKFGGRKIRL